MGNSEGLYLGKELDPGAKELGARLELDPADLLTHGLIVGMTGSGKTGLAIALIEEVLRQGVPVLAIDPKGDLGNLLLLFDDLAPAPFEPWIDPEAARREGKDVKAAAAEAAASWTKGLAEWGLGAADIAALKRPHDAVIYTPGSSAGHAPERAPVPRGALGAVRRARRRTCATRSRASWPACSASSDRGRPAAVARVDPPRPTSSRRPGRPGKGLTLETLIAAVADPPFDKLGALPLETVYPRKERQGLMMALNNLLASPSFEAWREGEPLDIEAHAPHARTAGRGSRSSPPRISPTRSASS